MAFGCAASSLEISSWDAETGSELLLFLLARSVGEDVVTESGSALELSRKLDGHALAISHAAGLMLRRSWTTQELFRAYQQNPRGLHLSALDAIWQLSFESLSPDSTTLLGVVSFLRPDLIHEDTFLEGSVDVLPNALGFCKDESRYVCRDLECPIR